MWNAELDEAQAGITIAWRNINNLRYADNIILKTESKQELKSLLMKLKEESENAGLKLNIQKTKIMASGPITSWQIEGETMTDFILLGSKITADGDCSHEIKRHLPLGRKAMTNLDSILKCRDITLPTKGHLDKAMVFLVVMCGCESWTVKKAEHQRIDAFELCCWRRLLSIPWTVRRSNQSVLKEISPEYSLEGLMLKLQYSGHLMQRTYSLEKTLMVGKIEGRRRKGRQGSLVCCSPWGPKGSDVTEWLNCTELIVYSGNYFVGTTIQNMTVSSFKNYGYMFIHIYIHGYKCKLWKFARVKNSK